MYEKFDKSIVCIAPGAFPSQMQEAVAQSEGTLISLARRNQAVKTNKSTVDNSKIINLILLVVKSSSEVNGKLLSANFDSEYDLQKPEFGFLRRSI